MTGFGLGVAALPSGRILVELRSVNHRYLDVRVRAPKELADATLLLEQRARKRLFRGRCEISVRLEGSPMGPVALNVERARQAFAALTQLRDELAPGEQVPLQLLAAVPDLFAPSSEDQLESTREALATALDEALTSLAEVRAQEGAQLAEDLKARRHAMGKLLEEIRQGVAEAVAGFRKRMATRLQKWIEETDGGFDPGRLEQEVIIYSEKSDVAEELTRLQIHLEAIDELLEATGPVGRKLDFTLQEVGREINTIGSKSQDARLARLVVDAKAELERMREQVQNVE